MSDNSKIIFSKPDLEVGVLGLAYIKESTAGNILPYLTKDDFTLKENVQFFEILIDLFNNNESINLNNVMLLAEKKKYTMVTHNFVGYVQNNAIFQNAIMPSLKELVRLTKLRKIQSELSNIQNVLLQNNNNIDEQEIIVKIQNLLLNLNESHGTQDFLTAKEASDLMLEELNRRKNLTADEITGIPSGFVELDKLTQGFHGGELIILAARPAMGKTAFALNIVNHAAKKNKKVVFFTLEMTATSLMSRLYGINTEIDLSKFKKPNELTESDIIKIEATRSLVINKLDLLIDESADNDLNNLIWKCRRLKKVKDIDLIVIDYLQLLGSDTGRGRESRQNEIAKISRALKTLALELKVPVIALSQLSREVEKREDKRPLLSDLRESGAIEQDADIVMFLYRKNYYKRKKEKEDENIEQGSYGDVTEVIIAKHRNGATDSFKLFFLLNYGKFSEPFWKIDDTFESEGDE